MDTVPNVEIVDPTPETKRFNVLKTAKIAGAALAATAAVLYVKSKLNTKVDGEVNVTVETDNQS